MGNSGEQMSTETLDEEIKTRVKPSVKKALAHLAEQRSLKLADISREAFREYLEKHPVQGNLPLKSKAA